MRAIVSLLLVATTVGCGSGAETPAPSTESAPAASAGAETTPEPPPAAEPEAPEAEPVSARPTGRGTLLLRASVANQEVSAHVRVLNDAGEETAKAQSGEPINLPAGNYELEVSIVDPAVMADTPTQRRELVLQGGQNAQVEARFKWAKVTLDVRVNGRSQPGAKVQLIREDEVVAELKSGAAPTPITPGRYEADVLLKGAKIRVKGLQFPDSATQTVPVNVRM
ncbi:MAG TPA: hypothetical protein VJR89_05120 [Polyangiales bacterium]|nr:hypothetical protein [Polyangiales bacterium]